MPRCVLTEAYLAVPVRFTHPTHPQPPPTNAEMRVDGGISGSAGEVLVFPVGDVLVCPGISVLLCEAEVDDIDKVALLPEAH